MNKILSQDEVDALLTGVTGGEVPTEPDDETELQDVAPYDFTDRSTYLQGRPLNLEAINDRLARLLRVSLAGALHRPVYIRAERVELKKFGDFVRALPVPTSLHLFKMEPLHGLGMMVMDSPLVFSLLETFFGAVGPGRAKVEGRDFTSIENKIIKRVVGVALADLEKAWEPIVALSCPLEHSETNPQFAELVNPDEIIISVKFEVELEEPIGFITFCIPYSNLEPIRERLETPYQRKEQEIENKWVGGIKHHLQQAVVEMAVELGRTSIPARDLLELNKGDILVLDQDFTEPLLVKVEEVTKFDAFAGTRKGNKAVKVNRFIEECH